MCRYLAASCAFRVARETGVRVNRRRPTERPVGLLSDRDIIVGRWDPVAMSTICTC